MASKAMNAVIGGAVGCLLGPVGAVAGAWVGSQFGDEEHEETTNNPVEWSFLWYENDQPKDVLSIVDTDKDFELALNRLDNINMTEEEKNSIVVGVKYEDNSCKFFPLVAFAAA